MNEVGNTGNNAGKNFKDIITGFLNKDFGMFKGLHIVCGVVALLVLVGVILLITGGKKKEVAYPALYINSDGDLVLFATNVNKEEKAQVLVSDDGSSANPIYANTTDRYVLFKKNGSLYIYDSKSKDKTKKVKADVSSYSFTENDKYVVFTVKNGSDLDLYSYDMKKDPVKVDSAISRVVDTTDSYVVYKKDDALYIRELKAKKDKQKISGDSTSNVSISKDGKKVIYQNEDGDLHVYTISSKKDVKIASEVYDYYANKNGTKFYYVTVDGSTKAIYYYNGKSGNKVVSEAYTIEDYDIDNQKLLYTVKDGSKYALYYKKGTKDAAKVEDDLEDVEEAEFNKNEIYYVIESGSKEILKYAKISGNKISKVTELCDNYSSGGMINGSYVYIADVDKNSNGTLYFAKGGKAKKADEDVYSSRLTLSNDGKKIYYYKEYSNNSGDLYVTSGGKGKLIDKEIHSYTYVKDNLIYYIKDYSSSGKGDLYRYTGGKGKKIASDVKALALTYTPNHYDPEA